MIVTLSRLNNNQLVSSLENLAKKEQQTTLQVILLLKEMDRRKLYLPLGYSSLFAYVRERLKYSEGGAMRRIQAARCLARFPGVKGYLENGRINLTQLSLLAGVLFEKNSQELLDAAVGLSKRETELLVARHSSTPTPARKEKVVIYKAATKTGPVKGEAVADLFTAQKASGESTGSKVQGTSEFPLSWECKGNAEGNVKSEFAEGFNHSGSAELRARSGIEDAPKEITRLQYTFSADEAFASKLARVQALLSTKHPRGASLEEVFGEMLEDYIKRHAPEEKTKRARKRKNCAEKKTLAQKLSSRCPQDIKAERSLEVELGERTELEEERSKENKHREYVAAATRHEVAKRDGYQCSFVGQDGKRCGSDHLLEFDHIVPVARGGKSTAENLRLRCKAHNLYEAERVFGRSYMEQFYGNDSHTARG